MIQPNFSHFINGNPERANFSSIVFGEKAPVLEVELNEMQAIFLGKLSALSSLLPNGVYKSRDPSKISSVSFDGKESLIFSNVIVILNGLVFEINDTLNIFYTVEQASQNRRKQYIYFSLVNADRVVTGEDTLLAYGLSSGHYPEKDTLIENSIIDPRVGEETSRRVQPLLQFYTTRNNPPSDSAYVGLFDGTKTEFNEEGDLDYSTVSWNPVYQKVIEEEDLENSLEESKNPLIYLNILANHWAVTNSGIYVAAYSNEIFKKEMIPVILPYNLNADIASAKYDIKEARPEIIDGFLKIYTENKPTGLLPLYLLCVTPKFKRVTSINGTAELQPDGISYYPVSINDDFVNN